MFLSGQFFQSKYGSIKIPTNYTILIKQDKTIDLNCLFNLKLVTKL